MELIFYIIGLNQETRTHPAINDAGRSERRNDRRVLRNNVKIINYPVIIVKRKNYT